MKTRHPRRLNHKKAKLHRSYTTEEIASLFGVHKNTVRNWVKSGLPSIDNRRPSLVLGSELHSFLKTRRSTAKRPCGAGQMFCLRCRAPRAPSERRVLYSPLTPLLGSLAGECEACGARMNRRASVTQLRTLKAHFEIQVAEGLEHIVESEERSLNCDLER